MRSVIELRAVITERSSLSNQHTITLTTTNPIAAHTLKVYRASLTKDGSELRGILLC